VADYRNVDPRIGTLKDFDMMMRTFKQSGIKVIVDIVPNHSSNEHPWFKQALAADKGSEERARYHFRDGTLGCLEKGYVVGR
jgi:alpha-glucosidase